MKIIRRIFRTLTAGTLGPEIAKMWYGHPDLKDAPSKHKYKKKLKEISKYLHLKYRKSIHLDRVCADGRFASKKLKVSYKLNSKYPESDRYSMSFLYSEKTEASYSLLILSQKYAVPVTGERCRYLKEQYTAPVMENSPGVIVFASKAADVGARLNSEVLAAIESIFSGSVNQICVCPDSVEISCKMDPWPDNQQLGEALNTALEFALKIVENGDTLSMLRDNYFNEKNIKRKIYLFDLIMQNRSAGENSKEDEKIIKDALQSKTLELSCKAVNCSVLKAEKKKTLLEAAFTRTSIIEEVARINEDSKNNETAYMEFYLDYAMKTRVKSVKLALIQYFTKIGEPGAEEFILNELQTSMSLNDSIAICHEAIAACGGKRSLDMLASMKNKANSTLTDKTIARIHQRLRIDGHGWLSVDKPGEDEGNLSVTGDEPGV